MILQKYYNQENGLESSVVGVLINHKLHYCVDVYDRDNRQFTDYVRVFSTVQQAKTTAQTVIQTAHMTNRQKAEFVQESIPGVLQ